MTCSRCRRSNLAFVVDLPDGQPACRACAETVSQEILRNHAFWSCCWSAIFYIGLGVFALQAHDATFTVVGTCMIVVGIGFAIAARVRS